MKIELEATNGGEIAYTALVSIMEATVDSNTTFRVPVYQVNGPNGPVYDVEIAGFRIETPEVAYLPAMIENLVRGLINMTRLPSYVFIARRSREMYPVYTVDNEVFATTPGGPRFQHVELAKVRAYLSDYLHAVEVLGTPGRSEKLHVRGVHPETLALIRPIFYLKKRQPGQVDFWAPVFLSRDGTRIYTYAVNARREVPIADGKEVIALRNMVAEALIADGRLSTVNDLRPDRLMPDYWGRLAETLTAEAPAVLAPDLSLPIYRNGDFVLGAKLRDDETRYNLFVGTDRDEVIRRATENFVRRGKIFAEATSVTA